VPGKTPSSVFGPRSVQISTHDSIGIFIVKTICCFSLLLLLSVLPANEAEAVYLESESYFLSAQDIMYDLDGTDTDGQYVNADGGESSDLVLFFGRFHPFFVHLPIGFLLFAFLLEFVSLHRRFAYLNDTVPFALLMGVLSGIAAGITGYMLSSGGGYGEDLLSTHKWLGISTTLIALAAFIVRIRYYDHPVWKKAFRSLLIVMAGVVMVTGHYGGSLTHGSDYLFRYMPESLRSIIGVEPEEEEQIALIEDLDTARVYDDIIQPILRTRCQSCHNPDRSEGELLMTSLDQLMAGGESGPVIVENNAEESELFRRLILPARDEERMPPRGRRQLTSDQIRLIGWWIDKGVPSTQMVSEIDIPEEIFSILNKLTVGGQSFFARTVVPEADPDTINQLREHGFRIAPIAEGMNFLRISLPASKTNISEEDFERLLPFSQQITWIDFSRIRVSDNDLRLISEFKHLTRLNLANTSIGDQTLERIGMLPNLEYLNVYATEVSDDGLQYVAGLENLKSLYVWQTKVNQQAVEELQVNRPGLYINFGVH
jgi:uncharacterized membrane protein